MKTLSQVLASMPENVGAASKDTSPIQQHGSTMADGTMSRALTPMGEKRMATPAEIDRHLKARLKSLPNLSVTFRKISVTDNEREFLRARGTRDNSEINR